MSQHLTRLSKFLAVVLRHKPQDFGIILDEQGFAPLDAIWDVIVFRYGDLYSDDDLLQVVAGDKRGKKRYEIVGGSIRAMYGHSQPEINYPVVTPPDILYHGTNPVAWEAIREDGLKSRGRQYVHLTTNPDHARIVAARKTNSPVLVRIRALDASQSGVIFHQPETEHYLAREIPANFIESL